jgi:hypothetical protein
MDDPLANMRENGVRFSFGDLPALPARSPVCGAAKRSPWTRLLEDRVWAPAGRADRRP